MAVKKSSKLLAAVKRHGVVTRRKGGGTLISNRPVFSLDAKYVYLNCGWGVRIFSVETGECVRVLESYSQDENIVGVLALSSGPVALSSSGVLIRWESKSGKFLKKDELSLKEGCVAVDVHLVQSLMDPYTNDLCVPQYDRKETIIMFYSLVNGKLINHPLNNICVSEMKVSHNMSFGGFQQQPILAVMCLNGISVYSLDGKEKSLTPITAGRGRDWTCVRCHREQSVLAAGDSTGRVVIWRNLFSKPVQRISTVYHWHTLPCRDIAFSPAGSSMYTGGGENVLVKWNVDNPNVRHYLPRLSAEVIHINIAPDNQLVAVATLDNGIQIVEAHHRLRCVLQQLTWGVLPTPNTKLFPAGIKYDPRTRSLVLNGRPGHLQFYSPHSETLLYNLDITRQNYLTQERTKFITNTEVTHSAVSSDGAWLSTLETRQEEGVSLELRLKMWQYIPKKQCFSLNTSIESPHSSIGHTLLFRPGSDTLQSADNINVDYMVVTTGDDDKFRVWTPSPIDSVYKKGVVWGCESVGFYRDKPCGPASFSEDGSLLAVGFAHTLTIWDIDEINLKTTLTRRSDPLRLIQFGSRESCHLVVSATESELCFWNLLTLSLLWHVPLRVSLLVPDPCSSYMAVFTQNNSVFVFTPLSTEPVYNCNSLVNKKIKVLSALFVPREREYQSGASWLQHSQLYYIDSNQELKAFECEGESGDVSSLQISHDSDPATLFSALMSAKLVSNEAAKPKTKYLQFGVLGASAITELLKAPAHTMPPISLLCSSLLQALVVSKKTNKDVTTEISDDEGINEASDGEEGPDEASDAEERAVKTPRATQGGRETEKKEAGTKQRAASPPVLYNKPKDVGFPKKPSNWEEDTSDLEGEKGEEIFEFFEDLKGNLDDFSYK